MIAVCNNCKHVIKWKAGKGCHRPAVCPHCESTDVVSGRRENGFVVPARTTVKRVGGTCALCDRRGFLGVRLRVLERPETFLVTRRYDLTQTLKAVVLEAGKVVCEHHDTVGKVKAGGSPWPVSVSEDRFTLLRSVFDVCHHCLGQGRAFTAVGEPCSHCKGTGRAS